MSETFGKDNVAVSDNKGNSLNAAPGLVKESDLGLPFYPGSDESKDAGTSMVSEDPKARVVVSYRSTKDDPAKVAEFYKDMIRGRPGVVHGCWRVEVRIRERQTGQRGRSYSDGDQRQRE